MSKRGDKPRRFMTKVRKQIGKPTMIETPKSTYDRTYDRNKWKRETEEILKNNWTTSVCPECKAIFNKDREDRVFGSHEHWCSSFAGGSCACTEDYICDKCEVNDGT